MGKRKCLPIVPVVKSRKKARKIVTQFHKINDEIARIEHDTELNAVEKKAQLTRLRGTLDEIGGRAAYQAASNLSVSFFNTSKWVLGRLKEMGLKPTMGKDPSLRLLEVGAINTTLLDCPWLKVEAIDLLSRHDRIRQIDFFKLEKEKCFDVIVASMVINSLPTAKARGEMLKQCHAYLEKAQGHLFLMLPLSCLTHSKVLSMEKFKSILQQVGFRLIQERSTPKIAFFLCQTLPLQQQQKGKERKMKQEGEEEGGALLHTKDEGGHNTKTVKRKKKASPSWAKGFDIVL